MRLLGDYISVLIKWVDVLLLVRRHHSCLHHLLLLESLQLHLQFQTVCLSLANCTLRCLSVRRFRQSLNDHFLFGASVIQNRLSL